MRIGLISDIHGNLQGLQAVLNALTKEEVALILCAGDMLCYGADNNAVLALLQQRSIPCVAGNYDYAVAWNLPKASRKPSSPRNEPLKQAALDWTKATLDPAHLPYLRGLPFTSVHQLGSKRLRLLHAGIEHLDEWITPDEPDKLAAIGRQLPADYIILGHSHQPFAVVMYDTCFINPGSIGRPMDGDPRASYAILDTESGLTNHYRLAYDLDAALAAIHQSTMPDEIAAIVQHAVRRIDHI